jgi:hypothetical protein
MQRRTNGSRLRAWNAPVAILPQTQALVARFTTPPSLARTVLINTLIGSLVTAGVWGKLDALYVMAQYDAQAAQQNWVANQYNLAVAVGVPVFTADRGYATNGTTSCLTTGFNPVTAAGKLSLNSAYMGVWALNLSANGRFGNDTSRLGWGSVPMHYTRANDGTTTQGSVSASARWFSWSRAASGSYVQRVNGADFSTPSVTSTALTNNVLLLGQTNGSFGAGPYVACAFGSSLTQSEDAALYNALNIWNTAVGAA